MLGRNHTAMITRVIIRIVQKYHGMFDKFPSPRPASMAPLTDAGGAGIVINEALGDHF